MARSGAAASVVVLVVMMALLQGSMATRYTVGEDTGWQLNSPREPNFYQDWVRSHAPYYTVDVLEFKYIAPESVLLVTPTGFAACNTKAALASWPADPSGMVTSTLIPLKGWGNRTMYFISGDVSHCVNGQKFSIDVLP